MRCARARRWIVRSLADSLSERRRRKLNTHLARCPACELEVRALDDLHRAVSELEAPGPGPAYWSAFSGRVRQRLERMGTDPEPRAAPAPACSHQELGCRVAAATILLAAVALALFASGGPEPTADPAAALAEALRSPGLPEQITPSALEVEGSYLSLEETIGSLSPREAENLRSWLQREMDSSRSPRRSTDDEVS
ncbi:MAG: zf-HC2 domain-containing protein [Acidobacteriota bacterium]